MNVKQVKELNERIEAIQTQRTKVETKKEMLMARLTSEISKYEEIYGVKLTGKSLKDTISAIKAEQDRVSKNIQEEYELKEKVITAIESGNIEEANRLLGIVVEEENQIDEVESQVDEEDNYIDEDEDFSDEDTSDDLDADVDMDFSVDDEEEDDFGIDDFGIEDNTSHKSVKNIGSTVDEVVKELDDEGEDFDALDDMDFDDFGFGDMLSGSKLDV